MNTEKNNAVPPGNHVEPRQLDDEEIERIWREFCSGGGISRADGERLCAHLAFLVQERQAQAERIAELTREHRRELADLEKEARHAVRDAVAEDRWQQQENGGW